MADSFLKVGVIGQTVIQLLFRELVLARTVWTDAVRGDEFVRALDDTVTLRVPAKRTARTRTLRAGTPLIVDDSTEFAVPVKLDTDVYNGAAITDEELTLDIVDFGQQVLVPQVRAVAEGIEEKVASEIQGATYLTDITVDDSDPYKAAVAARKTLNDQAVPKAERYLVVGSAVEAAMLTSDRFVKVSDRGDAGATSAFEDAAVGRVAGFTVLESNALDEDEAYAYHRTAFVLAARTPKVPQGAAFGQEVPLTRASQGGGAEIGAGLAGLSVRWVMDYDSVNARDRSFTSTYVGTAAVKDPVDPSDVNSAKQMVRAVRLHLPS